MNIDAARDSFIAESRELIADMELALLACERGDFGATTVNAIFRAAHTIKGNAGLFGFETVVAFTHVVESALDQVREGIIALDQEWAALLLECRDHMQSLIDAIAAGGDGSDPQLAVWGKELVARLAALGAFGANRPAAKQGGAAPLLEEAAACIQALLTSAGDTSEAQAARELLQRIGSEQCGVAADGSAGPRAANPCWHVSLRMHPEVLKFALEPIGFIRFLAEAARIEQVICVGDALPEPSAFDPELCYVGYELRLAGDAKLEDIETAFQFIREQCSLQILPPQAPLADYAALLAALPEGESRAAELLLACGALSSVELDVLRRPAPIDASTKPVPEANVPVIEHEPQRAEQQSIRVDAHKLENLINLVGELVIAGAATHLQAQRVRAAELSEALLRLSRLVEDVRDETLKLRMMPISATFARFSRIVRDVSRELGKEIRLESAGGDTELDKTLIEKITDPLTHLVRNAIDHGIETTAERLARGKNPVGTVRLNAYHDSGSVIIEVSDDGGGLNREKILAKALQRQLVATGADLTDQQVHALIFEPGFSTATAVTNLSGRGVGMDVVKRNVTQLRGVVEIDSREGLGTTIRVRLPLTLAIIEGFLVRVGGTAFVVPLDMIEECVDFQAAPATTHGHRFLDLRGRVLPLVCLRDHFGIAAANPARQSIVVVRHGRWRAGLLVDELLGEHQTVIKPLARIFQRVRGLGGSTILGDGSVALILEVSALIEECARGGHLTARVA